MYYTILGESLVHGTVAFARSRFSPVPRGRRALQTEAPKARMGASNLARAKHAPRRGVVRDELYIKTITINIMHVYVIVYKGIH